MAKISTYAFPSAPKLADYVIGTDTSDSLNTKNFLISDIVALAGGTYVPYTGATGNVDLNTKSLYARTFSAEYGYTLETGAVLFTSGSAGTTGQHLVSQGISTSPTWESDYVIPTGAVLNTSGSEGTSGQYLVSQGAGVSPSWQSFTPSTYRGSFYNTATQIASAINTATAMLLTSTDATCTSGFSISGGTRITAANTGVYDVQFSAQIVKTGGGGMQTLDIWLRKNGADIANTNTRIDLANNNNRVVAAWNFFVALATGENVEIMWAVTATEIQLLAEAAAGVHPATPSLIVTVNQV
jgi:hypothetical protein